MPFPDEKNFARQSVKVLGDKVAGIELNRIKTAELAQLC